MKHYSLSCHPGLASASTSLALSRPVARALAYLLAGTLVACADSSPYQGGSLSLGDAVATVFQGDVCERLAIPDAKIELNGDVKSFAAAACSEDVKDVPSNGGADLRKLCFAADRDYVYLGVVVESTLAASVDYVLETHWDGGKPASLTITFTCASGASCAIKDPASTDATLDGALGVAANLVANDRVLEYRLKRSDLGKPSRLTYVQIRTLPAATVAVAVPAATTTTTTSPLDEISCGDSEDPDAVDGELP